MPHSDTCLTKKSKTYIDPATTHSHYIRNSINVFKVSN